MTNLRQISSFWRQNYTIIRPFWACSHLIWHFCYWSDTWLLALKQHSQIFSPSCFATTPTGSHSVLQWIQCWDTLVSKQKCSSKCTAYKWISELIACSQISEHQCNFAPMATIKILKDSYNNLLVVKLDLFLFKLLWLLCVCLHAENKWRTHAFVQNKTAY